MRTHTLAAVVAVTVAAAALTAGGTGTSAQASEGRTVFVSSAVEHAATNTVTLPVYRGQAHGQDFWYVVLDASSSNLADRYGVNRSNKLANSGPAVQRGHFENGVLVVGAGVDFGPDRDVAGGVPGSTGEAGYSPLVRLPNGDVIDAPQIANATGMHDKVVSLSTSARTVTLRETEGRSRGEVVHYVSTDASKAGPAALEGATLAPQLDYAPTPGNDGTDSARAGLVAFTNGQVGRTNPQRQGIASALADGLDPLNVLAWLPDQGRYSPLWDVHLTEWTPAAHAAGLDLRQSRFADVEDLAEAGVVTGPGGAPWGASKVVVVCPIVSRG